VVDTTPPVITRIKDANVTHEAGTTYVDPGANWNDLVDGNGTADAYGTVDHNSPGIYLIAYNYSDHAGNAAQTVYRSVQVVDTQDSGYGDSNGFSLDTTDKGTRGDTGQGDSNRFSLDTTDPVVQKPLVNTSNTMLEEDGSIQLSGDVYFDGGGNIEDFGFVLSSTISLDKSKSKVIWVRAVGKPEVFTLKVTQSPFPDVMYFRAWARNSAEYGIGQVKKVRIPDAPKPWWGNVIEETGGWKTSDWFGTFIYYEKGWLYHSQLGWLYSSSGQNGSVWLWSGEHGWLWTKADIWPYLYKDEAADWLYFVKSEDGLPIFYDYSTSSYLGHEREDTHSPE
jgi:hypothetical protein